MERPKPTNKKTAATIFSQPSPRPNGIVACVKGSRVVMWPCWANPRSRIWPCTKCLREGSSKVFSALSFPDTTAVCRPEDEETKPMQSSSACQSKDQPAQSSPMQPYPCTHTHPRATLEQAPRKPSTVAWHNRPSATNLLRAETPRRIFKSSIWVFPRFFGSFNRREIVAGIT